MSKKRMEFPMLVQVGSVAVRIYKVNNRGHQRYTLSYFADGKRRLKMFADFDEAYAEAKSKANAVSRGDLDVLHLDNADRQIYLRALTTLEPTSTNLELAVKEYAEAWKILGGRGTVLEAACDFASRNAVRMPCGR